MTFRVSYKHVLLLIISVLWLLNVNGETKEQHTKVTLRTIGHEFLLQLDDSTSRVLPIEKIDGRYAIQFERELSFEPDLLFFSVFKSFEENEITESYIVEIQKCGSESVIHSFEASLKENDLGACNMRQLPLDCYVFFFTEINEVTRTEEKSSLSSIQTYLLGFFILMICLILYLNIRQRKERKNPDLISIGQYQFDKKGMLLIFEKDSTELSSKESDLLFLLFSNENKTLEREYILNAVWADGGNYVGRTLDVFISKLRKKLEADSSLKIVNVRGVGYRFVMS